MTKLLERKHVGKHACWYPMAKEMYDAMCILLKKSILLNSRSSLYIAENRTVRLKSSFCLKREYIIHNQNGQNSLSLHRCNTLLSDSSLHGEYGLEKKVCLNRNIPLEIHVDNIKNEAL